MAEGDVAQRKIMYINSDWTEGSKTKVELIMGRKRGMEGKGQRVAKEL